MYEDKNCPGFHDLYPFINDNIKHNPQALHCTGDENDPMIDFAAKVTTGNRTAMGDRATREMSVSSSTGALDLDDTLLSVGEGVGEPESQMAWPESQRDESFPWETSGDSTQIAGIDSQGRLLRVSTPPPVTMVPDSQQSVGNAGLAPRSKTPMTVSQKGKSRQSQTHSVFVDLAEANRAKAAARESFMDHDKAHKDALLLIQRESLAFEREKYLRKERAAWMTLVTAFVQSGKSAEEAMRMAGTEPV